MLISSKEKLVFIANRNRNPQNKTQDTQKSKRPISHLVKASVFLQLVCLLGPDVGLWYLRQCILSPAKMETILRISQKNKSLLDIN